MMLYQFTKEQLEDFTNTVFSATIDFLHDSVYIDEEQAEKLSHIAIILKKPGFFQRMKSKLKGDLQGRTFIIFVEEKNFKQMHQTVFERMEQ